jgi:hypothetical protein
MMIISLDYVAIKLRKILLYIERKRDTYPLKTFINESVWVLMVLIVLKKKDLSYLFYLLKYNIIFLRCLNCVLKKSIHNSAKHGKLVN